MKIRLLILAAGKRYELSRASAEAVGDPKQLVTLVLPLRGSRVPTEVEIEGVRGPATTYETKIALAK